MTATSHRPASPRARLLTHRTLLRRLLTMLLLAMTSTAYAFSGRATDNAFAALLAMPGAGPDNGEWNFPVSEDAHFDKEPALITYLAHQQKAGADFNAYRHFGTLLHHAIRAGKSTTALWLLQHGADPRLKLRDGNDNALTLAVQYQRRDVAAVLQNRFHMQAPPSAPAPAASSLPSDLRPEAVVALSYTSHRDYDMARQFLWVQANAVASGLPTPEVLANSDKAVAQWAALVAAMPPGVYAKLVDDDQAIGNLVTLHSRSAQALATALTSVPPVTLQRHADAAVNGVAMRAYVQPSYDTQQPSLAYSVPREVWTTLWKYLPGPHQYQKPTLAQSVPPDLWPALFASGYAEHDAAQGLGCLPADWTAADFKAAWPAMQTYFSDARQAVPGILLRDFRIGQLSCLSQQPPSQAAEKLMFLTTLGIREQFKGLDNTAIKAVDPALRAAMQPFIEQALSARSNPPRLVDATPRCTFELTAPWYRELLRHAVVGRDPYQVYVATVQLVEIPGKAECALHVGGADRVFRYVSGVVSTFAGFDENPRPSCPDPTDVYELWSPRDGRIERRPGAMANRDDYPQLIPVLDTRTRQRYYMVVGTSSMCNSNAGMPILVDLSPSGTTEPPGHGAAAGLDEALLEQCSGENGDIQCRGIAGMPSRSAVNPEPPHEPAMADAFKPLGVQEFIDIFRKPQHEAYLAAVLALDTTRLAAFKAEGVPGPWTAEAVRQVSTSALPVIEKRKRIAWLFADHLQLGQALAEGGEDAFAGLVEWLPQEDWWPVFSAYSQYQGPGYANLFQLKQKATDKGLTELACDVDRAQGLLCGERDTGP
ncbi:MAG: hypothetical protein V4505_23580 [Pseudomonadota bacterium]